MYSYERREIYLYLQEKLQELFETVSQHMNVPLCDITHWDICQYFKGQGVLFDNYGLPPALKDYVAGMLIVRNGKVKVAVNQHMPKVRQNFSRMHELIHLIDDVDTTLNSQSYSNILKNQGYNTQEEYNELKAEIGASILMVNDWALMHHITKGTSWNKLRRMFDISTAALRYRLSDFLIIECGQNPYIAKQLVSLYEIGDNQKLYRIVKARFDFRIDYAPTRLFSLLER